MIVGECTCGGDIPFIVPEKPTTAAYATCEECEQKYKLKVVTMEADE